MTTPITYRVRAALRMSAHERARLTAYLALLTRHPQDRALIELRARRPGGGMDCTFHSAHDLDRVIAAVQHARRRTDVYIGVAPRARAAGTKDAVEQLATLWVDLDGSARDRSPGGV